ncbi:hypothetical protein F5X71_22360 [Nocardia brasiliensis]|uniref:Tetratricopeptide repeat protein n=1 Tax=Nocardia brasiliensis TaxID=37326 RepID=A0A6G9XV48_NOCBR|nr:hypothetical protein [Nocardia brasiliensis]QIS04703.1 hypothetical protein F5X71_22360 [Nocardia brasiliensis]
MRNPDEQARPDDPAAPSTPRSTVWQGFLGTASVVAYALLFELARSLVINSLGDSTGVKVLAGTLRWLSVLVIVAAAVYVGYRFVQWYREKVRVTEELALLADLIEPAPQRATAHRCSGPPRSTAALNDRIIVAVLRELPVRDFETAALLAVLDAALDAPARLPVERLAAPPTAAVLLGELRRDGIVNTAGAQRYCLRKVPVLPDRADVRGGARWPAALTALVHHYADRSARWATALETVRFAAGARRWFEAEEPYLCTLVHRCAELGAELPAAVVPELARIGDALDVWYARIGLEENHAGLAADLCALPGLNDHVLHRDLARLRADRLRERPGRYRPRSLSTGLAARWEHRAALRRLERPGPRELPAVVAQLEASWWLLPREDVAGEVCALINLAVAHLWQGRLDAAKDRLDLADALTRTGRDPDGRAHVHETMGLVWWVRGDAAKALHRWQQALGEYRVMADDHGIARCLQHLGSALLEDPGHAETLLGPGLSRLEVTRQVTGWLATARRLHRDLRYAEHYAAQAEAQLGGTRRTGLRALLDRTPSHAPLTEIDRWPLPATDPPD